MTVTMIGMLLIVCVLLSRKAHSVRSENAVLKDQVASLKRQLARLRA